MRLLSPLAFYGWFSRREADPRNEHDDSGATFDFRIELLKKNVLIGAGELLDIGPLPSYRVGATAIVVPLSPLADTLIPRGTELRLRVLVRMGARAKLHRSAGVRLSYDSVVRPSRIGPLVTPPVNRPPLVDAGPDIDVTLPNTAAIDATVTDDGLPQGGDLTVRWTKQSGPGTVTFDDAAESGVVATFSEPGTYVLRLTASDSQLSSFDEVTVTVHPQPTTNHPPTAVNDSYTVDAGATLGVPARGVLTNDTDPDVGDTLTAVIGTAPVHAAAFALAADGSFTYTPTAGFSGSDSFTYTAKDPSGAISNVATAAITVRAINRAPVVSAGADQEVTLPATATLNGSATDDGLPPGVPLVITWTRQSGPGTVTFGNAAAAATTASFSVDGTYVLRLTASDSQLSSFDEVTVTVHPVPVTNHPPAAVDDSYAVDAGGTLNVPAKGVLGNDSDPDAGDTLTAVLATAPAHAATFTLLANGSFSYVPAVAFVGSDGFTYTARDAAGAVSNTATVTITVRAVNRAPVVDAGPDQEVTLPATAPLSGSVTDDGLPAGATLSIAWTKQSGPGTVTFSNASAASTTATFSSDGTYVLQLTASDSALSSHGELTVIVHPAVPENRPPHFTSSPILSGAVGQPYSYQATASDPDSDPLSFSLTTNPDGMTVSAGGLIQWTPSATQSGPQDVTVQVSDGRGGSDTQPFTVEVTVVPVVLTSINATPEILRFSALEVDRSLTVTGLQSDSSSVDLTGSSETTYESSNPFVASVGPGGIVHSLANGSATITVHYQSFTDTAAVVVEVGVALQSLALTPSTTTLRRVGESVALTLQGHFSDGETRDLTSADGTVYQTSAANVASIGAAGVATAIGTGDAIVTAHHDVFTASADVHVAVSSGVGFVRGQVLDDSKGLPLAGAIVELLADGSGPLSPPVHGVADDRGRYALEGLAGDALVRVTSAGFTSVERHATIPAGSAVTAVDARLTPVDSRANGIQSVFGGQAHDAGGAFTLVVPPGGLATNTDVRLTPVSGQGLQGRLSLGWSPVSAVNISPEGLGFPQPATLTLPNLVNLPANAGIVIARYAADVHDWVVVANSQIAGDGRSVDVQIGEGGQLAILAPDDPPVAPPASTPGNVLAGAAVVALPGDITASGEVVPRSAPPGDQARAVGHILLKSATPLPSGTLLRANVAERFDLTDQSQIVPPSYTEDVVLYSRGRPTGDGVLGASLPIAPSRSFTIQELLSGVVSLDVAAPTADPASTIVGPGGGTVADTDGDSLEIAAALLTADTPAQLQRVAATQTLVGVPSGFDLLAAVSVDLAGAALLTPARLSIPAAPGAAAGDQILVALVFRDGNGVSRLRLVAVGGLESGRIVATTTFGTLSFPGITLGGQYLFLRAQQPLGFVAGHVLGTDGVTPRALGLVTSDTAPFADASSMTGGFIVAARAAADSTIRALDVRTHDAGSRTVHLNALNDIVTCDISLAVVAPTVVSTTPSANATNVALDTPVSVDFSDAIDPATVSTTSVALAAAGVPVTGQITLSSDQRHLVFRPSSSLQGKSSYTLTLAGIQSTTGRALAGFTALTFATVDPSKPTLGTSGLITGDLPDDDGIVLITGGPGASDSNAPVTGTNLRTQETTTVLANQDGSFRLRLAAAVGDELTLTLRDSSGRDTTMSLTQLQAADGTTTVGELGGTVSGPGGRAGIIMPRALTQAGIFHLTDTDGTVTLASLPAGFSVADRFRFSIQAAQFNRLSSVTLTESQNRFAPQTAVSLPFAVSGDLVVPGDFLLNASLKFAATATDVGGGRRTASVASLVVPSGADTAVAESSQIIDFPTVFIAAPTQAVQNQAVHVEAIAPSARVDFEVPAPAGSEGATGIVLVRQTTVSGESKLSFVDLLERVDRDGMALLRTDGRELPGASVTGEYAIVAASNPLVFVRGRLTGAAAVAILDGSPFVFETDGPNGSFILPVAAGQPYAIRFVDQTTGALLGTSTGQAPASGQVDLGFPLAPPGSQLLVSATPDSRAVVDINLPLTFRFSEAVDARTLTSALIVTDSAGARVFGATTLSADGTTATFTPSRRWKFGTTYRWAVGTSVQGVSGARLQQQAAGEFSTFAPRLVSTTPLGAAAHDVAVSGGSVVVATDAGLTAVDASSALTPAVKGQLPLAGGARGVAFLPVTSFTDRLGAAHNGSFAVVAAGDASGAGKLSVVDLTTPDSPSEIGSTQLTTAGGTPNGIAVTPEPRAFAAIQNVGVASVGVGDAVPPNPAVPGSAVSGRYPSAATENINQSAVLGDRLVTVGAAGLTVLDAVTLERRGGVSTTGNAQGVAVLQAYSMDLNGDGIVETDTETFDLAVVANGADGTIQFYDVPPTGDPTLLSVVHTTGTPTGVALDATERLAYVALGAKGLALVDLDGPASIQPIDLDRDGSDDRMLGAISTAGGAERTALALDRGLLLVAGGSGGLSVLQVLPPRTRFVDLKRDPVAALSGDEESILESHAAFSTDDGLLVSLEAIVSPGDNGVLALDEQTVGPRTLSFADGSSVASLRSGLNNLAIRIARGAQAGTRALLTARIGSGDAIASLELQLVSPDPGASTLDNLTLVPSIAVIGSTVPQVQLAVAGFFSDGRVRNLTTNATGTGYQSEHPAVASVDADGLVVPGGGGQSQISAVNGNKTAFGTIVVDRPPTLVKLAADPAYLTLRATGAFVSAPIVGEFSDGSRVLVPDLMNVAFATGDPSVATVDSVGHVSATGPGTTTLTATSGSLRADVLVSADLRVQANISSLSLEAPDQPVAPTDAPVLLIARALGTGSLDGLNVTFTVSGAITGSFSDITSTTGEAALELPLNGAAGSATIVATAIDPATGATRTATASVQLVAASADSEPNDSSGTASLLTADGQAVGGHLDAASDPLDMYRVETAADGVLKIALTLGAGTDPGTVTVVVRSANGDELTRLTPTDVTIEVRTVVPIGTYTVTIEATAGAVDYTLSAETEQGEIVVSAASPLSGPPGTPVTITGSGFSINIADTSVLFGGVEGKLVSVSATSIVVLVPANAVDGALAVISGDRRAEGPTFIVGVPGPRPAAFVLPGETAHLRRDPIGGYLVDITRLDITADPLTSRAQINSLASSLGGAVVGFIPSIHLYVLQFPANTTFDGLASLTNQLRNNPIVVSVSPSGLDTLDFPIDTIDILNVPFPNSTITVSRWFQLIEANKAVEAIRSTPPFDIRQNLNSLVVAVIDDGFKPFGGEQSGSNDVTVMEPQGNGFAPVTGAPTNPGLHGTGSASLIIEPNNETGASGVLASVVQPGEPRYSAVMYDASAPGGMNREREWAAIDDIAQRSNIPVLNMSFSFNFNHGRSLYQFAKSNWIRVLNQLKGKTLAVASAGNDGAFADYTLPAALARTMKHVLSVGAVAVANQDGSGEGEDARAVLKGNASTLQGLDVPCAASSRSFAASNCGSAVLIAAPGEDIAIAGATRPLEGFDATSAAAPIVAGVAALVQTIAPGGTFLQPDVLRGLLIQTADDISDKWNPGKMVRVNAFKAVNTLLSAGGPVPFYTSDAEVPAGSVNGAVVSIEVDPLRGTPTSSANHVRVIPLVITAGGATVQAHHPTSSIVSPAGDWLYVVASDSTFGDGIVAVNTRTLKPVHFVPLSGAAFPPVANRPPPPPITLASTKPGLAISRDGRLLYVSADDHIIIVNTEKFILVNRFIDMPREYASTAASHAGMLEQRLAQLPQLLKQSAAAVHPGTVRVGALSIAADGRTLFAAIQTGGGGGQQPGFVQPINVDLYVDPTVRLDDYFVLGTPQSMSGAGNFLGGDEPSAIAASPDGKQVYLLNGGVNAFEGVQTRDLDLAPYAFILGGGILGAIGPGALGGSGLLALSASLSSFQQLRDVAYNSLLLDLKVQSDSGITLLSAPGMTGVFPTRGVGDLALPSWAFPSEVVFGWNPDPDNGGRIVNQFLFRNVFAKRPFGMSFRPDGKRALVSFFQTGNFGVLDQTTQTHFASPSMVGVDNDVLKGIVGVTPSIRLDGHLWPSRGAFTSPDRTTVPSPDENLLYPGPITYSQNGKFAVAAHTGNSPPTTIQAELPDFVNDNTSRLRLNEIGFDVAPQSDTGTDPDGASVSSFDVYDFKRGGGAVTVIHDDSITSDLTANATLTVSGDNGGSRPYYAQNPICATPGPLSTCQDDVFAHLFDYPTATGNVPFYRPRGISIQPFVTFQAPGFGDRVVKTTTIRLTWRHTAGSSIQMDVFDLDQAGANTPPPRVGGLAVRPLTQKEVLLQAVQTKLGSLVPGSALQQGHRYRITATVNVIDGNSESELASESIVVTFVP